MTAIGRMARPLRNWLARRGLRTVMHKNRGQSGFAGFTASWRADDPDGLLRCAITTVPFDNGSARFVIVDEDDLVQRELAAGRFYEPEELAIIGKYFRGGTFVDIGSNIGNHAIFVGLVLSADRIIAVEPNPDAARLCEYNLLLNNLGPVSVLHRCGISDLAGKADIDLVPDHNLGGVRLTSDHEDGAIELVTGDQLLADSEPSFLKIDTEGFELRVLQGLRQTLQQHSPTIFVEVEDGNLEQVAELLVGLGYVEKERFARYPKVTNFLYEKVE